MMSVRVKAQEAVAVAFPGSLSCAAPARATAELRIYLLLLGSSWGLM